MPTEVAALVIDQGMMVMQFPTLCILDWDYRSSREDKKDESPKSGSITIEKPEEAYAKLALSCMKRPEQLWAVYSTWGGVRALMLNAPLSPTSYRVNQLEEELTPDNAYMRIAKERGKWAARVSNKPGRSMSDDRINFTGFLGTGTAHPELLRAMKFHHTLLLENNMTDARLPYYQLGPVEERLRKASSLDEQPF